jgi:thymidylate kinase
LFWKAIEEVEMEAHKRQAPWIVVTGMDGAGKTTLAERLTKRTAGHFFRLPFHAFVPELLGRSGQGTPFGDVHTDRLLFAADARLANDLICQWRTGHRMLVSQRGWMDNFIFGAVQGVSYETTDFLLQTAELQKPSAIITLLVDPEVAFSRIQDDPDGDKYETPEFLRLQHRETLEFRKAVRRSHPALTPFAGIPDLLIETTAHGTDTVYRRAVEFLHELALI